MTVIAGALAPLALLTSTSQIPRPGGVPLGLAEQGVWTIGVVLVVRLFRRTRSVPTPTSC
ncbi:hypothetical protein MHW47_05270 [Streptomyces sp. OfavH-34-F]|uniref:hypothetical protein n=1 Tax=Streptomyces sp. OfavH-34-F TaxID=2917760 RepID=UPI001EF29528|nr:hypothetical protein [Streptomyces sp. OfavH-34-F]MCG7523858.1 hypothetical protein [Streptomyces sp. OfavH-34-F]